MVDNDSSDATCELIRNDYPSIELIRLPKNEGFGAAVNRGIQEAFDQGTEYVLILNHDIVLSDDVVQKLSERMELEASCGVLSAFQLTYDDAKVDPQFRTYAGTEFWDDRFFGRRSPVYWVGFVPAAAILVRRATLLEIGGFDPLFFMYGEDDDLCRRVLAGGWKVGFVPDALVQHWNGIVHARKSFRWLCTREYSEAVFHLKSSPRVLGVAFLTLIKRWAFDWGFDIRRGFAHARPDSVHPPVADHCPAPQRNAICFPAHNLASLQPVR